MFSILSEIAMSFTKPKLVCHDLKIMFLTSIDIPQRLFFYIDII